jgi:Tol biopolymer transport system component
MQTEPIGTLPAPSSQRWPEALRDQPRPPEPFPLRLFLLGVLPGIIGAALLLAMTIYLEQRANRQIVYLTTEGRLAAVRADGTRPRTLFDGLNVRIAGSAHWSPDGRHFAAIAMQNGRAKLLVAQLSDAAPALIDAGDADDLIMPGQPWSGDGAYLALLRRTPDNRTELFFADVAQARVLTATQRIESSMAIDWQPGANAVLVTTRTDVATPTLQLVGADGAARPLAPQDQKVGHGDAAWSPDGRQIAYVASPDTHMASPDTTEFAGSLWIAQADGSGAREVVADGVNLAPVWAPRGDLLFFTRLLTETREFALYRVQLDGQQLTKIGPSTPAWGMTGADRSALLSWSPDRSQLFFQGAEQQRLAVYSALYDGSNPRVVYATSDSAPALLTARWMPSSRAVLSADASRDMRISWVNQEAERPPKTLPRGIMPALQP